MPELDQILKFMTAGIILNIIPGSDVMYIVSRSISQGRWAGLVSAMAIAVGSVGHVIMAVLGLSAILATSATAFMIVKYAGAAYLVYMGVRMILSRQEFAVNEKMSGDSLKKIFWQGVITNLLNPKVALFFLAFLPQFIPANDPRAPFGILLLGAIFIFNGLIICAMYSLLAGWLRDRVVKKPKVMQLFPKIGGGMLALLGVKLALERR